MEGLNEFQTVKQAGSDTETNTLYSFNEFIFDCKHKHLYQNGTRVNIESKMAEFLCLLVQRSPEAVSKNELLDTLWKGQIVTEWSLSRLVSDTRKMLGDDGKSQRCIQTSRGKGFCFSAELKTLDNAGQLIDRRRISKQKKYRYTSLLIGSVVISCILLIIYYFYSVNNKHAEYENLFKVISNLEQNLILTKTSHEAQKRRRNELGELLKKRFELTEPLEWEKVFSKYYPQLNETELFIFAQIRAITDGPIYTGNFNVLKILKDNPELKDEFTSYQALVNHLSFWLNKYEKIFTQREDMCLLYSGEEDGVPFPSEIDQEVNEWIKIHSRKNY